MAHVPDDRFTRRHFTRRALTLAAATSSLPGVLAACGGGDDDGGGGAQGGEPPGLARVSDPDRKAQLRKLLTAAEKEGQVNVWDTIISPETWSELEDGFKSYWGLSDDFGTNYTNHTTSEFVTKASEEIKANRVTMDVGGSASIVWLNGLVDEGKLMHYSSPDINDAYKPVFDLKLGRKGYYASNVYYFVPAWNPEQVKKDIKTWNDVVDPAFGGGKIIMGDASLSESYTMTHLGLRKILPVEYFRKLAALGPAFKVKSQDIIQDVATGEHPVAFSGMPTRVYQMKEKGVELNFVFPDDGTVLLPQATFILDSAPHPNAAKLYAEYFLSEEGQQIYVKGEAVSSGRRGFKSPVPDYAPPIEQVKAIPIDWTKVTQDEFLQAREEWTSIFKHA